MSGPVRGIATSSAGVTVQFGGDTQGDASLSGRASDGSFVRGQVTGRVWFSAGAAATGCSDNEFTLAPR